MALDFSILEGIVKIYGAPLYGADADTVAGQVTPSEYTLMADGRTIQVIDNGNTMYFPIRRSVIEAGFGEDKVFTIGLFTALRDASGTTEDGKEWSVNKGDVKPFAF